MANPQIAFRLSYYQLALALKIIHKQEPELVLDSPSQIVKTIFIDYIQKYTFNESIEITNEDILKVKNLRKNSCPIKNINEFLKISSKTTAETTAETITKTTIAETTKASSKTTEKSSTKAIEPSTDSTKSTISTVTNFEPPKEWTSN